MKPTIYMDYSATTLVEPSIVDLVLKYRVHNFGNASGVDHCYGDTATEAIGLPGDHLDSVLRISLGTFTTDAEVRQTAGILIDAVQQI